MISLATTFSGIGAIEQAFLKSDIDHTIVFACDNGERNPSFEVQNLLTIFNSIGFKDEAFISKIKNNNNSLSNIYELLRTLPDEILTLFTKSLYNTTNKENKQKKTFFANYQIDDNKWFEDVRLLNGVSFHNQVDLFVGGSPCQAFSSNGKRGGLNDIRGTLFYEYCRLIKEIQPKAFIFENVQGLLIHDHGHSWDVVKSSFFSLGYDIYINHDKDGFESPLLDAQDYGIPQRRKRIFLIGIKKGCAVKKFKFPEKIKLTSTINDYLETQVDSKYYLGKKGFEFVTKNSTRARIARDIMGCQKANQQFNWNGDFIFIPLKNIKDNNVLKKAYIGEYNGTNGVIRKFTPRECLRLMGFPDTFKIVQSDIEMYKQCGNSIVVNVLQHIIQELFNCGALR